LATLDLISDGRAFYPHHRAYFEQNMPRAVDYFPRSTFDDWPSQAAD